MKTYLYNDIIRMSNDLIQYAHKNIKDIRNPSKLTKFPIFLNDKDCINLYRANYYNNSNNWTYKIIATKICPFILEFATGDKIKISDYGQLKEIFKNNIDYKEIKFNIFKGSTDCYKCPISGTNCKRGVEKLLGINCQEYDLTTIRIDEPVHWVEKSIRFNNKENDIIINMNENNYNEFDTDKLKKI